MAHCVIREEEQDKSVEERREENHNCACACVYMSAYPNSRMDTASVCRLFQLKTHTVSLPRSVDFFFFFTVGLLGRVYIDTYTKLQYS